MSIDFLIPFCIFFFACGVFVFPFFLQDGNKPLIKRLVTAILATTIFAGIFGGGFYIEEVRDNNNWNNGYCPNCGIHWTFSGGSRYRSSVKYYYTCENCYTVIETSHIMR